MRKLAVPFAVMIMGVVLFFLWIERLPPFDGHPEPVETALEDLRTEQNAVRVSGTAHYPVRVSYEVPARWGHPAHTRWLFPLFGHQDTMGRYILAMVSSPVKPERLVAFEDMEIAGEARKPRIAVTPSVEQAFRDVGYTFADDYVLIMVYLDSVDSEAAAP